VAQVVLVDQVAAQVLAVHLQIPKEILLTQPQLMLEALEVMLEAV
jgi:hypothetical protein